MEDNSRCGSVLSDPHQDNNSSCESLLSGHRQHDNSMFQNSASVTTDSELDEGADDSDGGGGGTLGHGPAGAEHEPGGRSRYKHVPHKDKPRQVVARRNARERRRVQTVNGAFMKLRKHIPYENRHKRLSKVKTLRTAIDYIRQLQGMVSEHDSLFQTLVPTAAVAEPRPTGKGRANGVVGTGITEQQMAPPRISAPSECLAIGSQRTAAAASLPQQQQRQQRHEEAAAEGQTHHTPTTVAGSAAIFPQGDWLQLLGGAMGVEGLSSGLDLANIGEMASLLSGFDTLLRRGSGVPAADSPQRPYHVPSPAN